MPDSDSSQDQNPTAPPPPYVSSPEVRVGPLVILTLPPLPLGFVPQSMNVQVRVSGQLIGRLTGPHTGTGHWIQTTTITMSISNGHFQYMAHGYLSSSRAVEWPVHGMDSEPSSSVVAYALELPNLPPDNQAARYWLMAEVGPVLLPTHCVYTSRYEICRSIDFIVGSPIERSNTLHDDAPVEAH